MATAGPRDDGDQGQMGEELGIAGADGGKPGQGGIGEGAGDEATLARRGNAIGEGEGVGEAREGWHDNITMSTRGEPSSDD